MEITLNIKLLFDVLAYFCLLGSVYVPGHPFMQGWDTCSNMVLNDPPKTGTSEDFKPNLKAFWNL